MASRNELSDVETLEKSTPCKCCHVKDVKVTQKLDDTNLHYANDQDGAVVHVYEPKIEVAVEVSAESRTDMEKSNTSPEGNHKPKEAHKEKSDGGSAVSSDDITYVSTITDALKAIKSKMTEAQFDQFSHLSSNIARMQFALGKKNKIVHLFEGDFDYQCKSNKKAESLIEEGNRIFNIKKYKEALRRYNASVMHAEAPQELRINPQILNGCDVKPDNDGSNPELHSSSQSECTSCVKGENFSMDQSDIPENIPTTQESDANSTLNCAPNGTISNNNLSTLSQCYASRSAAFYHISEYEKAIEDVNAALYYGYDKPDLYKLLDRKGKSQLQLERFCDAKQTFTLALTKISQSDLDEKSGKIWTQIFEKHIEQCGGKTNSKQGPTKSRESDGQTYSCTQDLQDAIPGRKLRPKPKKAHSVYENASEMVSIERSVNYGRHAVANGDISPGDVLVAETPFSSVLYPEQYLTHCFYCAQRIKSVVPCRQCAAVGFCSISCEEKAWDAYHRVECRYLLWMRNAWMGRLGHLAWRITVQRLRQVEKEKKENSAQPSSDLPKETKMNESSESEIRTLENGTNKLKNSSDKEIEPANEININAENKENIEENANINAATNIGDNNSAQKNRKCAKNRKKAKNKVMNNSCDVKIGAAISDSQKRYGNGYREVSELDGHENARDGDTRLFFCIMSALMVKLLEHASRQRLINISKEEGREPTKDELLELGTIILHHLQVVQCNSIPITEMRDCDDFRLTTVANIGLGVYPTAALLNHSCNPNAVVTSHDNTIVVTATRNIAKGEQIFIDYGPEFWTDSIERRRQVLKTQYNFECTCEACRNDWPIFPVIENDIPVFICPECRAPLLKLPNKTKMKCSGCKKLINHQPWIAKLQESHEGYNASMALALEGNVIHALPGLTSHLVVMQQLLAPPWRDFVSCHASTRKCLRLLGNRVERVKPQWMK